MKNRILLSISALMLAVSGAFAQMINMGDAGYPLTNTANCNTFGTTSTNFQDPGGAGNYPPNYNDTIVFCPDLTTGTKMSISMGINAGYTWNVDGSDFVYVYDGPSTASPLLGVHNSVSDPNGFTHQATWNNPSGCLTIVFISNGTAEGTGWLGNVQCGYQFQPFEPHIEAFINGVGPNALNPIDTGFVDVCFGDSILFVAKPIFPYSLETTGYGYSQNVNSTVLFDWNVTDGGVYPANDSIWFTPPARSGYLVDVKITDQFPQFERMLCKVRVSQLPIFAGTGPLEDTVCMGQNTELIGGVTPTDTVGVNIPGGTFQLGGAYAGTTYLPDGSGIQYQTTIPMSGFPPTATITNAQDLNQVCITMEHSYAGDLELWLQCPTGQIVQLVNSYSPGFLAGGTSGGSTYLGDPIDDSGGGGPGEGWEYCFSSVFNTIGAMNANWTNTVPVSIAAGNNANGNSMDPSDVYAPNTSFASLAGCPINGNWTIFVQDNLTIDDGYIFEWGLFFDGSFFPGLGGYQNTIASDFWENDPTIISGQNDTSIVVQPNMPGAHNYVYHVIDDFGCEYDTTVTLYALALPTIFPDTIGCDLTFTASGTVSVSGGVWTTTNPQVSILPNANANNPTFVASTPGTYTVSFTDNSCNQTVTSEIIYPPYPMMFDDTLFCSLTYQAAGTQVYSTGGVWSASSPNVSFSPSTSTLNPLITASSSGNYIITFTDNVCNNSVSANLTTIVPPSIFTDDIGCYGIYQIENTVSFDGGVWTASDTAIRFNPVNTVDNPLIYTSTPGTYQLTYTDNLCNITLSALVTFPPNAYTDVLDTIICQGTTYTVNAQENFTVDNFVWNTGATGPSITITEPGEYIVTATNICHTYTDTATIGVKICDIEVPNIIVLSSLAGNEAFYVTFDGVADFNCVILNRWGNKIYEYSDPLGKWDGKTTGGTVVEEGTYFYIIKATFEGGNDVVKQGFVQVKY